MYAYEMINHINSFTEEDKMCEGCCGKVKLIFLIYAVLFAEAVH